MRAYHSLMLVGIAAAIAWAGCESAAPHGRMLGNTAPRLSPEAASAAGLSSAQTNAAVQLYTAKCLRCHQTHDPTSYAEVEWRSWMSKMSRKAHLTPEQSELISRYLHAYRAAAGAPTPETR